MTVLEVMELIDEVIEEATNYDTSPTDILDALRQSTEAYNKKLFDEQKKS